MEFKLNKNLTYKLLEEHLIAGKMLPDNEISILPNHVLLHDSTGVLALLSFDSLNISSIKVEKAAIYIDHNILQVGCENANDHIFLSSSARKYGLYYFGPGLGICHQLHREYFGSPGQFLLGADSHTTTAGAIGMIGIGAGGLDVALALAGQPFNLILPKVTKIELKGELPR